MIRATEGNSLIVLINREDEAESSSKLQSDSLESIYEKYLYDAELVKKLSEKGLQPSVELLAKNLMIVELKEAEMNSFQKTFIKNFLVQCLYKPEVSDSILKMGIERKKYKLRNFEEDAFSAVSAIKKDGFAGDKAKIATFEEECKMMGFGEKEKSGCVIF